MTTPRLFLDSAEPRQWKRLLPQGYFHGVTTNPLLLERAGQNCTVANLEILSTMARDLGAREIQLQTWGPTHQEMISTGLKLAEIAGDGLDVVVKIPATAEGFQTARRLRDEGIQVTMTAVYTPGQVMLAAAVGAAYAAPYVGRLDDVGQDGSEVVKTMHGILADAGSDTRLLTASLRTATVVVELAAAGLDTFTFGPAVADELLASDLTNTAAADFQRAATAMGNPAEK